MKKRMIICLGILSCAALLSGCGKGGSKEVNVDISKLSQDLQGTISSGALAEVSPDIMASTYFYDTEKVEESTAALNSGASACEVAIVKCKDSAYTEEVEGLFENYVKQRSELFADYNAPEAAKLDDALIETAGNYVVLCVTDDKDAAEKILDEAGFSS